MEIFCSEPTAFSQDPRLLIRDPRLFTHDPRLFTHDPRLFTHDPRHSTHDPRLLASPNFSCNLQCNSTLKRCKIAKYESSLHSTDVFSTYRKFFTDFTNQHLSRVELHCKLQEKLHRVTCTVAHKCNTQNSIPLHKTKFHYTKQNSTTQNKIHDTQNSIPQHKRRSRDYAGTRGKLA